MVRLGALLRRSRNKDAEPEAQAPVGPTIDTPPLVVMIPDVAGVSSFRLYTFTDAQAASRFILSLSRPQRERAHAFWALQAEPADPLETEDNAGEAMVLIRSEEGSDLVYVVSFVDIESAQSFARFEVKRGMHLGLILIYWASMVNVVLTDDKVQLIPERPPRVAARLPVSPASPGTSYRVADAETEFDDRLAMEEVQAEEQRLAAETAERARLEAEAEEQRRREAEADEQRRLAAEAEERRLAAEAEERTRIEAETEERRLAAEAEEQRRLATEAKERARLEAEAEERRLAAEAEERARLEAEAEERRLAAEAKEQARLEAEAEERRLAAEAEEQARLEEEEQRRLAAEAEERARLEAEAEERRLAAEAKERARLEAEAEERRRLEEEAERWRLEAEAEDRARLEAAAEERRRLEAEAEERALAEAIAQEKRRLQEEEEERFQAAKRSILAQEEEDFGAGGDEDEHEEAVAGSASEASFERNPIEELLRGEAESRVQVPQAFAKEPQDGADEDSPNGLEHEINPADIADEVGKILRRRRWAKRESPFEGFKSPPGRF
ncbi:MAG: hypothetical protein E6I03_12260 [Chloroflexi bacterium]|nr:MAG: hypothetical protein E6I03_12260 [Chloroflexota bacterium]